MRIRGGFSREFRFSRDWSRDGKINGRDQLSLSFANQRVNSSTGKLYTTRRIPQMLWEKIRRQGTGKQSGDGIVSPGGNFPVVIAGQWEGHREGTRKPDPEASGRIIRSWRRIRYGVNHPASELVDGGTRVSRRRGTASFIDTPGRSADRHPGPAGGLTPRKELLGDRG